MRDERRCRFIALPEYTDGARRKVPPWARLSHFEELAWWPGLCRSSSRAQSSPGPTVPLWVENGTVEIPCPVGPTGMSVGPCVGLLVGVLATRNPDMVSGCKPWPTNDCERPCVLVARHVVGPKMSSGHPQRRFRRPSITVSGRDALLGHRPPIVSVTSRQAV
jgi:hypothetical protein